MKIRSVNQILLFSVGFTFLLIAFRIYYSGDQTYLFFVWNLFLAWVPLMISNELLTISNKYVQWILFGVWLLFFPNALYIITDLLHLKERYPVPMWFDVILIFSAALNGLLMGFLSLKRIEDLLLSKYNERTANLVLIGCLFISSFGIYLGRFQRWNSWDVISNPKILIIDILQRFINPFEHPRTWGMTIIFSGFFTIFYFAIKRIQTVK